MPSLHAQWFSLQLQVFQLKTTSNESSAAKSKGLGAFASLPFKVIVQHYISIESKLLFLGRKYLFLGINI